MNIFKITKEEFKARSKRMGINQKFINDTLGYSTATNAYWFLKKEIPMHVEYFLRYVSLQLDYGVMRSKNETLEKENETLKKEILIKKNLYLVTERLS